MRHVRQCGPQCQSRHRAASDCSLSNSSQGKASCSCATCREGREIFRCCPLEGTPNAKVGHLPTWQGMESATGMAPPSRERLGWMSAPHLFFTHYASHVSRSYAPSSLGEATT